MQLLFHSLGQVMTGLNTAIITFVAIELCQQRAKRLPRCRYVNIDFCLNKAASIHRRQGLLITREVNYGFVISFLPLLLSGDAVHQTWGVPFR
jgi:hypothetical protein